MRIGIGYDIHRFNGRRGILTLGGIGIPQAPTLAGHSDADVLLHALADALLGAIGAPDLGELFPPTDPKYRHADSRLFVQAARARIARAGWRVSNVDATVVTDEPTLTPYKPKMRRAISRLLQVKPSDVSVKAKTTEGLPPGKRGIAAQVVVLLKKARR
ncbi:MAG: 2-C-methyl-D-erythritol 2,4-cyclodiphosphate synthase [Candidatus Omnitrophica bacterium]|nr:2-C-methyl-D-erythritol 2,4-cyclodiphosphate synthase [Candidatus Omnitrophota bacterium]